MHRNFEKMAEKHHWTDHPVHRPAELLLVVHEPRLGTPAVEKMLGSRSRTAAEPSA